MADLKDILKGINEDASPPPPDNPDFTSVQPNLSDQSFYTDILDELGAAEVIDFDFRNADRFYFLGSKDGDEDVLGLENGTAVDFSHYRNVFIGKKGTIGKVGELAVFPYISSLPSTEGMTPQQITNVFGAEAITSATPDNDTYITIGGYAKGVTPIATQMQRIFVGDVIIVGNFPTLEPNLLDLDEVVLHEQGEDAIVISEGQIDIYPASIKRNINVNVCGAGLARKENTKSTGELRALGGQASCVAGLEQFIEEGNSSANLIRVA